MEKKGNSCRNLIITYSKSSADVAALRSAREMYVVELFSISAGICFPGNADPPQVISKEISKGIYSFFLYLLVRKTRRGGVHKEKQVITLPPPPPCLPSLEAIGFLNPVV